MAVGSDFKRGSLPPLCGQCRKHFSLVPTGWYFEVGDTTNFAVSKFGAQRCASVVLASYNLHVTAIHVTAPAYRVILMDAYC